MTRSVPELLGDIKDAGRYQEIMYRFVFSAIGLAFMGCDGGGGSDPLPDAGIDATTAEPDAAVDAGRDPNLPPEICRTPAPPTGDWFTEVTEEVGLAPTDASEPLATTLVAADVDADGWTDFFAAVFPAQREPAGTHRTRFLYMNRPDPEDPSRRIFVDAIDDAGLLATRDGEGGRGMTSMNFADVDNDGDLDAIGCAGEISTTIQDGCAAFLNDGSGHFALPAEASGDLEADLFSSGSSVMLDYDLDGILDYWPATIGVWQYGPAATSHPRLYRGRGDGTFDDVSEDVGLPMNVTGGPADYRMMFGMTSCDADLDGDRDVIIGCYGATLGPNYVYLNEGGRFENAAWDLGVDRGPNGQGGFTFAIACGDIEDDGDVDLMTAELHHYWYPDLDWTELLLNDTPAGEPLEPYRRPGRAATGIDRPHVGQQWTEGDAIAHFADVDLDGRKDVFIASVNYPQQSANDPDWTHDWLYRQIEPDASGDPRFEDVTDRTPWPDRDLQSLGGAVLVDIDDDGDLDVITGTGTYNSEFLGLANAIHVFRNEIGQDQNMARIRIVGAGEGSSNVSGIGARVDVTAGGRTQHQEVLGAWAGQESGLDLTFGLGAACEMDEVVVHWPNAAGDETVLAHVPANYLVEIREGATVEVVYRNLDGSPATGE